MKEQRKSMAQLTTEAAIAERDAIARGDITLRMVMDALFEQEKQRGKWSLHDIQLFTEALNKRRKIMPDHLRIALNIRDEADGGGK